jgi:hypothetical protein
MNTKQIKQADEEEEVEAAEKTPVQQAWDEGFQCAMDAAKDSRTWVLAIIKVLSEIPMPEATDSGMTGRLEVAFDRARVAACQRLERIMNSDLREP